MANDRNVAALKAILVGVLEPGNLSAEEIGDLAEDLAARSVLVPSTLTNAELTTVWEELEHRLVPDRDESARRILERIAKGDA